MTPPIVAVVGAGPAGIAAALSAASANAHVMLVDENDSVGGQLRYRLVALQLGARGPAPAFAHVSGLQREIAVAGIETLLSTRAWGAFTGPAAEVITPAGPRRLQPDALVLATGSTDAPLALPGWTLPGVCSARAAQILLNRHRVLPGRRWAIAGSAGAEELMADISQSGGEVVARSDDPHAEGLQIAGERAVEAVIVEGKRIEADCVVIAAGRQPDAQLALMLECDAELHSAPWVFRPWTDAQGATSVPMVFAAGDCAGVTGAEAAWRQGAVAGLAAAAACDLDVSQRLADAVARLGHRPSIAVPVRFGQPWRTPVTSGAQGEHDV